MSWDDLKVEINSLNITVRSLFQGCSFWILDNLRIRIRIMSPLWVPQSSFSSRFCFVFFCLFFLQIFVFVFKEDLRFLDLNSLNVYSLM